LRLSKEPVDSALHRLNENQMGIRASDRKNKSRQAGAAAHVADPARSEQGSDESAIKNVTGPQAGEFEGANQPEFFAVLGQITGVAASELKPNTKDRAGFCRLDLES